MNSIPFTCTLHFLGGSSQCPFDCMLYDRCILLILNLSLPKYIITIFSMTFKYISKHVRMKTSQKHKLKRFFVSFFVLCKDRGFLSSSPLFSSEPSAESSIVLACTSKHSSLYLLASTKAASTFLGICYRDSPLFIYFFQYQSYLRITIVASNHISANIPKGNE